MEGWEHTRVPLHEYLASIPQEKWKEIRLPYRDTFLHMAVRLENIAAVKMLLPLHLNTQDKYGITPLHEACSFDRFTSTRMLCEANANLQVKNENGRTPFDECIRCNSMVSAQILMLHGCRLPPCFIESSINYKLRKLESQILKHRSLVCSLLCMAKKKRDYRWDRFLLYVLARQVWNLRFEAAGFH